MSTIEFELSNGKKKAVTFEGSPTEGDIEEVAQTLKQVEKETEYRNDIRDKGEVLEGGVSRVVDLTPSGLMHGISDNITSTLVAPIEMIKNRSNYGDAFKRVKEEIKSDREKDIMGKVTDTLTDIAGYAILPQSNLFRGSKIANMAMTGAEQGAVISAIESLKNKGLEFKENLKDTAIGTSIGGMFGGVGTAGLEKIAKTLNDRRFQNGLSKTLEILTSVPRKYSQRAIEKEFKGSSILRGKFDVENEYKPIGDALRKAKNMLPEREHFANEFYKLGERAYKGINEKRNKLGEDINRVLKGLDENKTTLDIEDLKSNISETISKFSNGGDVNPALERASREISDVKRMLGIRTAEEEARVLNGLVRSSNERVKAIDLHNVKELLYDIANYDKQSGIKNSTVKAIAEDINQRLRKASSEYARVNDKYSLLKDIESSFGGVGGVNSNTIASKLMNYGEKSNILNGMDNKLKNVDAIIGKEDKFFRDTKELKKVMNEIEEILSQIGNKSYERNPRLLSNVSDTRREDALNELQRISGVKFTDKLNDTRAREALESLLPGQGGGSGSSEGYANLFRNALTTSLAGSVGGVSGSLGGAIIGLLASSPKIMAKSAIKNVGNLYQMSKTGIPKWLIPILLDAETKISEERSSE